MVDTLFDPEYDCFKGFMDMDGNRIGTRQSFGHDCEISYLALDMAELTGDEDLISRTKEVCTRYSARYSKMTLTATAAS